MDWTHSHQVHDDDGTVTFEHSHPYDGMNEVHSHKFTEKGRMLTFKRAKGAPIHTQIEVEV